MNSHRKVNLTLVIIALLAAASGFAAQQNSVLKLQAVRVEKGPQLDGILSDQVWAQAVPFSGFLMVEPEPGSEPTEKTELRVLYDEGNLYLGIYCYDSEPKRISANSLAHDRTGWRRGWYGMGRQTVSTSDDVVRILIDPFLDKRTAYVFYVNSRGARSEGLVSGGNASLNWDGIWEAKAAIQADGWAAEIKIPFKTISFKKDLPAWGLNVERYIARKQETIRLSGISRDANFNNPMTAAELEGISDIRQGLGITIRPYGLVAGQNDRLLDNKYNWKTQGGVDIYKNITPNLVAALTYNTDFAETEVDERRLNLNRFPLFFPEKRMFFLEGSETFNFSSSVSFFPFFSRRIGLYQGQQVPINFGAKLYGKVGKFNLSLLDMETRAFDPLPRSNMFAGRITYDFLQESKIGVIVTSGSPTGNRNTLVGFDLNYASSRFAGNKNIWLAGWAVYNWNDRDGRHHGFGLRANYPNDLVSLESTYAYYGEALDPGLAYMMRQGIQTFYLKLSYNPRPSRGWLDKAIRQFFSRPAAIFTGSWTAPWKPAV